MGLVVLFQHGYIIGFILDIGKITWDSTYNNLRFAVLRMFRDALYHVFDWRVEQLKMLEHLLKLVTFGHFLLILCSWPNMA